MVGRLWLLYSSEHMGLCGAAREGEPAFMPVTCSLFFFFPYPVGWFETLGHSLGHVRAGDFPVCQLA